VNERDARNPQHAEMADESMVRTLAAQAELIWPQEVELFRRYGLAGPISILDAGCGTGEITHRLAELYPHARILGVDLLVEHLDEARRRYAARHGDRLRFAVADALALELADASFDLVVCRHMLQSVPDAGRAIAELARVARPGGRLHLLCEDYEMIHVEPSGGLDPDLLWTRGAVAFGRAVGTDLRVGRNAFGHLRPRRGPGRLPDGRHRALRPRDLRADDGGLARRLLRLDRARDRALRGRGLRPLRRDRRDHSPPRPLRLLADPDLVRAPLTRGDSAPAPRRLHYHRRPSRDGRGATPCVEPAAAPSPSC
jgi:SAM-dependent methyltransferase